jgi:hypothetical protein
LVGRGLTRGDDQQQLTVIDIKPQQKVARGTVRGDHDQLQLTVIGNN